MSTSVEATSDKAGVADAGALGTHHYVSEAVGLPCKLCSGAPGDNDRSSECCDINFRSGNVSASGSDGYGTVLVTDTTGLTFSENGMVSTKPSWCPKGVDYCHVSKS